jgi:hypothetical protein
LTSWTRFGQRASLGAPRSPAALPFQRSVCLSNRRPLASTCGRMHFGIGDDALVLFTFDVRSQMERKNPAVSSWRSRRSSGPNGQRGSPSPPTPVIRERSVFCTRPPKAGTFCSSGQTRDELEMLMCAADCYVSCRSGFARCRGIQALGVPVIATHYWACRLHDPRIAIARPSSIFDFAHDYGPYRRFRGRNPTSRMRKTRESLRTRTAARAAGRHPLGMVCASPLASACGSVRGNPDRPAFRLGAFAPA